MGESRVVAEGSLGLVPDGAGIMGPRWFMLAAMLGSMFHGQEAKRSGGAARCQEVGVRFLSECQEMNSSVESSPGHILEEILWVQ